MHTYVVICLVYAFPVDPFSSPEVSAPAPVCLSMEKVYDSATRLPRPEVLKEHFMKEGRLEEEVALTIIREGLCVYVCVCVCVCVHGVCTCRLQLAFYHFLE